MEAASVDPPLGTCPVHPDKNAWRVCGRCGRFLCAICTFPTEKGPFCEPCHGLVGKAMAAPFTAMMVLPFLLMVLIPIETAIRTLDWWSVTHLYLTEGLDALGPIDALGSIARGTWPMIPDWVLALAYVYMVPRFLLRKRGVPRQLVWLFGAEALLAACFLVIWPRETPGATVGAWIAVAIRVMFCAYFHFSDAPKRTFVR